VARLAVLRTRLYALERENARLKALAFVDPLTGLANRQRFESDLTMAARCARRYGGELSLLMIDLDGMKGLNDRFGHPAGDKALRRVGAVLQGALRGSDLAARLGGDEFAVILPATGQKGAARVARRLRAQIAALALAEGGGLTASIGVATLNDGIPEGDSVERLVARADRALYEAKRKGRDRVECAEGFRTQAVAA
jgi:diguanylate cyclase (GGDEF)-like protein